jgi:hypothetical protein
MRMISAIEMANDGGVNPKRFRAALRGRNFPWHQMRYERWTVEFGGPEHRDMQQVLNELLQRPEIEGRE